MPLHAFNPAERGREDSARPAVTVRAVVDLFLRHGREDQADQTWGYRQRILSLFCQSHGTLDVAQAKPFHLLLWLNDQPGWKSNWTRKSAIGCIQRAFNWASKLGVIDRNPFAGVHQPEGEPGRSMTDWEYRKALRNSTAAFRRVLIFLRYTGARPGEMSAIESRHVYLGRNAVVLDKHKTVRKTKRPRVLVLHPIARRLVVWLLARMAQGQSRVFVNRYGDPWSRHALAQRMRKLRKKLYLPGDCKVYGLRHKFGTDAVLHNVPIKTLAVLMGHTDTRTTERYVHVEDADGYLGDAVKEIFRR